MRSSPLAVSSTARSMWSRLCIFALLSRAVRIGADVPDLSITREDKARDGLPYFLGGEPLDLRVLAAENRVGKYFHPNFVERIYRIRSIKLLDFSS